MIPSMIFDSTVTVLIIDDDAVFRVTMQDYLEEAGFDVREADNGSSGLAAFAALRPDIVLLDFMMPDMDGFAVCEKLRASSEGKHVPILMILANEDIEAADRAFNAGATDFTAKPVTYELFIHRIRYMLRAKETADRLREREKILVYAQHIAKLGTWEWNPNTDQFICSEEVKNILGWNSVDIEITQSALLDAVHADDSDYVKQLLHRSVQNGDACQLDFRIVKPDETEIIVKQKTEVITDADGNAIRMLSTIQDITETRRVETRIRRLAYYDDITGLPNRSLLHEHLKQILQIAKRHKRIFGILFIDLDHFKRINDTWGHRTGDELLRQVAVRLAECARSCDVVSRSDIDAASDALTSEPIDTIARLGGDEFVVLLTELRCPEDGAVVAQRIITALASPFILQQTEIYVTASIGISSYPIDGEDVDTLLKQADEAMYEAKGEGRNSYHYHTADTQARAFKRLTIETQLRKAIENEQFTLHYQPKIDIQVGVVVGMEALIRWQHPESGVISPADFIPIAEESGLIIPIGDWVLDTACAQTKAWQSDGLDSLSVSVNISAVQFRQRQFDKRVSETLVKYGVEPKCIELELTESLLVDDVETHIKLLHHLKAVGVQLSIDDFGTGYSSLSYLKQFPINTLKIDRSFILDMATDEDGAAIVKGAIGLAHSLRLRVVAEGVEDQHQHDLLHKYGCDEIQGYFYSRPLPANEVAAWIKARGSKTAIESTVG